jgi:TrkA domain protein
MQTNQTTVPGGGVLHRILTRDGASLCLLVDTARNRHLLTYVGSEHDEPIRAIVLEPDEADQVADILRRRLIADRLLSLKRRVDELIGERGR